jgi:hypothetical protein
MKNANRYYKLCYYIIAVFFFNTIKLLSLGIINYNVEMRCVRSDHHRWGCTDKFIKASPNET